ncbi:hypothetical protein BH20ACI3_BH20ACI3_34130 [soil metagenome]
MTWKFQSRGSNRHNYKMGRELDCSAAAASRLERGERGGRGSFSKSPVKTVTPTISFMKTD